MNTRAHIHAPRHRGDRIADMVTAGMGSWTFISIQALIMACWIVVNTLTALQVIRFDIYPFVFLNLAMSAEAAFSSPLILMSQNRQADKDRKRDNLEASEVKQMFESHELLIAINKQQLTILQQQTEMLELMRRPSIRRREVPGE